MKIDWMNLVLILSVGFLVMFVCCVFFSIRKYNEEYSAQHDLDDDPSYDPDAIPLDIENE